MKFKDLKDNSWYWILLKDGVTTPGLFINNPDPDDRFFVIDGEEFYSEQIEKVGAEIIEPEWN